jgi:hypothetical protein
MRHRDDCVPPVIGGPEQGSFLFSVSAISKREFANRKPLSPTSARTAANRKHLSIGSSTYPAGVPMRNTMRKAGYLVLPGSTRDVLPGRVSIQTI